MLEVAPPMATPPLNHWYVSGPVPLATTLKVAVCPALTVWFAGSVVISGAVFTVRVAGPPVAVPAEFVTMTVNSEPLSPITVAGVV